MRPFILHGKVQSYPWGKRGRESLVSRLLKEFNEDSPYAELWIGAHAKAPSMVVELPASAGFLHGDNSYSENSSHDRGEKLLSGSLHEVISSNPSAILGASVLKRYGDLPFLLKVISVGSALSIQAHPGRQMAAELHKRQPQQYPDANAKSELTVAITPLSLLLGFRSRERIMADFARVPECFGYLNETLQQFILLQQKPDHELLSQLCDALMRCHPDIISAASVALIDKLSELPERTIVDEWVLKLSKEYPDSDPGLFCFYLLNYETLLPGEGLYISPGTPHAYLEGDVLECLSNSDNVARAGLTNKYKDVESFLSMLNYSSVKPKIIKPSKLHSSMRESSLWRTYAIQGEFFLDVLQGANLIVSSKTDDTVALLFALDGHGSFQSMDAELMLEPGSALLLPADLGAYEIGLNSGTVFRVRPNLDGQV